MLSNLEPLQGQSFLIIKDLSRPDTLLGGVNLLPFLMTLINLASAHFYTKQASRRDKIQLYGILLFFLVILYNASSALVFYWTCNNIFFLLKNIVSGQSLLTKMTQGRYLSFKATPSPNPLVVFLKKIAKKFALSFLVAFLPFNVVFIAGGIDLYLNNINELSFTLRELWPVLFEKSFWGAIFLAVFLFIMPVRYSIFNRFVALVIGISAGLFLEGSVLSQNYGLLDGTTKIELFDTMAQLSLGVWVVAIFVTQYFYKYITGLHVVFLTWLILWSPLLNINKFHNEINTPQSHQNIGFHVSNDFFDFSKNKNIIIIVLDSFSGEIAEEIFKDSDYQKMFDGFYWLKDFAALFPTTKASAPVIIGATPYDNRTTFAKYLKHTHPETLSYLLKQQGYVVRASGGIHDHQPDTYDNLRPFSNTDFDIWEKIKGVIGFSFYPHHLKSTALDPGAAGWDFLMLEKFKFMNFTAASQQPTFFIFTLDGGSFTFYCK